MPGSARIIETSFANALKTRAQASRKKIVFPEGNDSRTIEAVRLRFDAAWLTLPLIGRLARGYNAARFASTLAMLAAAGVPILKALQAAAETLHNRAMRADALDAPETYTVFAFAHGV